MSDATSHSTASTASPANIPLAAGQQALTPQAVVRAYHQRTKHQLQRFAAGPDTLDWDAQPDPFRQWAGSPLTMLPLVADTLAVPWSDLAVPQLVAPQPMSHRTLAALLELSFGLTAWKQFGPDRWALRANPSSGNLHPTEAYVLSRGVSGLGDGLYHYAPREHALALRAQAASLAVSAGTVDAPQRDAQLWVGLSSIQWREAWKYGERAFRYCQLDVGHAVAAVRYAAAVLGWQARVVPGLSHAQVASLLGLDRQADFGAAEREEPELLIEIGPRLSMASVSPAPWGSDAVWHGQASRLDRHPMYRWPVIDEVARATQAMVVENAAETSAASAGTRPVDFLAGGEQEQEGECRSLSSVALVAAPTGSGLGLGSGAMGHLSPRGDEPASTVIRGRRSAQHFDRRATMSAQAFYRIAQALMPEAGLPWDAWPHVPSVHAVIFAHRVDGLTPGAYVLPRSEHGGAVLRAALQVGQQWQAVPSAPSSLPLQCLVEHPAMAGTLRTLSCHQAIASDACFAVSLLAEFDSTIDTDPSQYRDLYQEAGLIGQVLYLQAEAEGMRGTGIGCYFDDAVHELLGLTDQRMQVLYHFTVGVPTVDTRISTEPAYANREHID
jgi:SagB-type dehydrogenase family enzyme